MTYEEKSAIVIEQLRADRDRLLDVLDKIRAEIDLYLFQNEFGAEYRKEVLQIIDKYKAEIEEEGSESE